MNKVLVELKNINLSRNNKEIISNMSLSLYSSSVINIFGQNGSGKTSLLKILVGITEPSSGNVIYNIEEAKQNGISYIGHRYGVKNNLTLNENLLYGNSNYLVEQSDIDEMIKLAQRSDADMVVSVKETSSNPYYVLFEEDSKGNLQKSKPANFTRRQDCPTVYEYNGSIYVIKVSSLLSENSLVFPKTIKYQMDDFHSVDIDNQFDFDFAEFLLNRNKH